jgi:hypothetical protein
MAHGHGHRKSCECGFCTKSHRYTKRKKHKKNKKHKR